MATYFVDPYKKYYDKLSTSSDLISTSKTLGSNVDASVQIAKSLLTHLSSSTWNDSGQKLLVNSVVPGLTTSIETLNDSITDGLAAAATLAIDTILPKVTILKTEDENYERLKNELDSLVAPQRYDQDGNELSGYSTYIRKKAELEVLVGNSRQTCIACQDEVKEAVSSIQTLDGVTKNVEIKSLAGLLGSASGYTILSSTDQLLEVSYMGEEFYVTNSKINPFTYSEYVRKNGMTQNAGALGNQCMVAAQYYVMDMIRGTYTNRNNFKYMVGSPATKINNRMLSDNPADVLGFVFSEVQAGRPVVLQTSQKKQGLRHLVTVVGFKKGVTNSNNLSPENILVLDNVDGKVQTLAERNRRIYNQGKGYQALGATNKFLNTVS